MTFQVMSFVDKTQPSCATSGKKNSPFAKRQAFSNENSLKILLKFEYIE